MKNNFDLKDYLIIDHFQTTDDAISELSKTDFSTIHLILFQGNQQNLLKSEFKINAPKLREIIFAGKKAIDAVEGFEKLFGQLSQLISLKFVNIPMKSIPQFVFNQHQIKELLFRNVEISFFPSKLFELKMLERLSFTFAPNISSLPDEIAQLRELKKFALHGASPDYVSPALFRLPKLQHISLIDTSLPQTKGLAEALDQFAHKKNNILLR